MLKYRLITGPFLIALLLVIIWLDDRLDGVALTGIWRELFVGKEYPPNGILLFLVSLIVAPVAALELTRIFAADGIMTRPWLTALAAMIGVTVSYCVPTRTEHTPGVESTIAIAIVSTAMILVFVGALLVFSRQQNVRGVVAAAGAIVFAMVYLGLMLGFLLALRRDHSAWLVVGVVFVTKACDTGAYFTGRAIGRHKMIPWLSPGKTWEGLAGGIAFSALVGIGLAALSRVNFEPSDPNHVPWWLGLICGVVFAIVGQFGDLTMSLFKRGAGLKDASSMLPGLGGVLDVLDSPLMVAPVAFWIFEFAR